MNIEKEVLSLNGAARQILQSLDWAFAILTGPQMVLEFANDAMLQIWARDKSIIGKQLLEFMPELREQEFPNILQEVFTTGTPYKAEEALVYLLRNNRLDTVYMDFSYKPFRNEVGEITSILVMATDITERVVAKKQLALSEANLRNTISKAPVAMCIFRGPEYLVDIANDRMVRFWGKTTDDVIGKPIFEGLPEAKAQGFEELLYRVFAAGETIQADNVPVTLPRGEKIEIVYVNFVYEPYRDLDGNIIGVIAVAHEVTEQLNVRKRIEESEQRVRAVVESAPFPIGVYTGAEMLIELANQSIIDVWGKGADVIGKRYTEILPELENQEIFEQLAQVYHTGIPFHARNQQVDLVVEGKLQPYYFNYSFTPVYANGQIYGVMNTAAEVTDLVLAKQQVEQSERNFRNMVLQAPVAMCILLGPQHVVEVANELMLEIWGKPVENVLNRPIFEGLPDAREQGLEDLLNHVYKTGETFTAHEMPVVLLRNGKTDTVYQNFVYEPYKNAEGIILGVLAISIDVSAQVLARQKIEEVVEERTRELAIANSNLQRSNSDLEQFAYIASHDLQEPLRKVKTYAQMLEHSLTDIPELAQNYFEKISRSTGRMSALIRDVLAYSQLANKKQTFERVDLNEVLNGIRSDFELLIEQKNAQLQWNNLPVIEAIPLQMSQLFSNLVSNALKFSAENIPPVVSITTRKATREEVSSQGLPLIETHYNIVEVQDNGIGFEQEYADQIFNIFQRLHGKDEYSGTGIGLALCKKIALNHNGDISARSTPGQGTTFTIFLPLKHD
ncbi:MAG: PAS domain-containing protein [Sphingobacteriales bacterium]|nr:MAG: PAS domain-containing protein [Sphingobacteriales bacterium]